jgi:2-oxopent-4-enoate/cis-2-oxohex-4-enoate hydratase
MPTEIAAAADALWEARVSRKPGPPLSDLCPGLTLAQGYEVSRLNFERGLLRSKAVCVGKKIGLTSASVQKHFGSDRPIFGRLSSDMRVEPGGTLEPGALMAGRVEGEAAFVLKRELRGPGVTREDVIAATDSVAAAIEIVDSRVKDWKLRLQDMVADNSASARFVLGPNRRLDEIDLRAARMTMKKNGRVEATGRGTDCLGDPVLAVAWLANALGDSGEALPPGDIILSGAFGPLVSFQEGDLCEMEIEGLGSVSCVYGRAN